MQRCNEKRRSITVSALPKGVWTMSPISFFTKQTSFPNWVLILFAVLMIFTAWDHLLYDAFGDQPDEWVWVGGEKGIRQVPVFYVDEVFCNHESINIKGCYDPNDDIITVKEHYKDMWVPRGCTVLTHEIGHAWGLSEAELDIFNCDNPNQDPNHGKYDKTNIHHWNPIYVWEGWGEPDPRSFKWN
jgi:hypothetical protein